MINETLRTLREDAIILASLALLALVVLSALTGMGMDDEVEGLLPRGRHPPPDLLQDGSGRRSRRAAAAQRHADVPEATIHGSRRREAHPPASDEVTSMKCPVCSDTDVPMTDRRGAEIDCCPICRSVWLDRGELDRIIERANAEAAAPAPAYSHPRDARHDDDRRAKSKKRGGFPGDILGGLGGD